MTPYYADDWLTVHHGDCLEVMAEMEPESVHCVVTSPPYWGLRDYGDPGQLGLEPTPEAYVVNLVAVFREVRRVLRADGTVWLNLGDCYQPNHIQRPRPNTGKNWQNARTTEQRLAPDLKQKDLVGIPWRVAFALQADGWYLRSDIIWSKPNPMPESVTDRPTKSHEYLFLLSKSARYCFDAEAVREANAPDYDEPRRIIRRTDAKTINDGVNDGRTMRAIHAGGVDAGRYSGLGRNIRSVWTIATAPYPGAHFATFPPKLVEPCIKAGTSEKGVCPECGAPWERVVADRGSGPTFAPLAIEDAGVLPDGPGTHRNMGGRYQKWLDANPPETTGWQPTCVHDAEPIPALILDPFAGSGTTGMVAQSLSRRAVLIDLSLDYLGQLMERNAEIPLGLSS